MALRTFRVLFVGLVALAALATVGGMILFSLDLAPYRGPLESRLSDALDRQVRLAGEIRIQPSIWPTVRVQSVAIANPDWARRSDLATAEFLSVRLNLLALVRGEILVERIVLTGGQLHLETDSTGRGNWLVQLPSRGDDKPQPKSSSVDAGTPLNFPRIEIRRTDVDFLDGRTGVVTRLAIRRAHLEASAEEPVQLGFVGTLRGRELTAGLMGGPLPDLLRGSATWPVRIAVVSGNTTLSAFGELQRLPSARFDLDLHTSGTDFSSLDALLGIRPPPLGAFDLNARLVKDADGYEVRDVHGYVGPDSADLRFSITRGELRAPSAGQTRLIATGTFRSEPFSLQVNGAPYPQLLNDQGSGRLEAALTIAQTEVNFAGTVAPASGVFDMQISAQGRDISSLDPLVGRRLPSLGPFSVQGLLRRDEKGFALRSAQLIVASTDLRGDLELVFDRRRPRITGNLRSGALHLGELRDGLDRLTRTDPDKAADEKRVPLDERPLPVALLRAVDADLRIEVDTVLGLESHIADVRSTLRLKAGILEADGVRVRLGREPVHGRIVLNVREDIPRLALEARGRNLRYGPVLEALTLSDRLSGVAARLDFTLDGQGRTLAQLLKDSSMSLAADVGTLEIVVSDDSEPIRFAVSEGRMTTGGGAGLELDARGSYRGTPLTVRLSGDGIPELKDDSALWRVRASGRLGTSRWDAEGSMRAVFKGRGVDLRVSSRGERLSDFTAVLQRDVPALGPYSVQGHLVDSLHGVRISELEATLGESDFVGQVRYSTFAQHRRLRAELQSRQLRLMDLDTHAAEPAADDGRAIPDLRFPVEIIRSIDLNLAYSADVVRLPTTEIRDLALDVVINDGNLAVYPLEASVWNGKLAGTLNLNAGQAIPEAGVDFAVTGLNYALAIKALDAAGISDGSADFTVSLKGTGLGLRQVLSSANGTVQFVGGSARIDNRFLDLWASELLLPPLGEKQAARLTCAVGRFDVAAGVASSKSVLLDIDRVLIKGNGSVNLKSEELDFLLWPESRDRSVLAFSTPVRLTGSLSQPNFAPQARGLLEDVVWLLVTVANPVPAVLVNIIKPSAVEGNPCLATSSENGAAQREDNRPPNIFNKTTDFFRGLGNLLSGDGSPGTNQQETSDDRQ